MLILSDRQTRADRLYWEEASSADFVSAPSCERIEKAISAVRSFASTGDAWVAVSWGKDSVVLADLAMRADTRIPLVHVRLRRSTPETELVRDRFLARYSGAIYHEIDEGTRSWPHAGPGFDEAAVKFGPRSIRGIRQAESHTRAMSAAVHGISTKNACRPILYWSAAQVWGYLALRDLPIHPAYGCVGGGRWDRDWIRVGTIGGVKGRGMGRREWELEYYPDEIRRIEAEPRRCES